MLVIVRPEAEAEAAEARDWYEGRRFGLGQAFVDELDDAIQRACEAPEGYPIVVADCRRVLLHRFPHAVFYQTNGAELLIVSVFHCKREPGVWTPRVGG